MCMSIQSLKHKHFAVLANTPQGPRGESKKWIFWKKAHINGRNEIRDLSAKNIWTYLNPGTGVLVSGGCGKKVRGCLDGESGWWEWGADWGRRWFHLKKKWDVWEVPFSGFGGMTTPLNAWILQKINRVLQKICLYENKCHFDIHSRNQTKLALLESLLKIEEDLFNLLPK